MWKIIFILTVISVNCNSESGTSASGILLSCDHPLRVLQPELFTHCNTCFYGTWSNWYRIGHAVSSSHCNKSGYAYQVERTRQDNYGKCKDEVQQQYQCEPTTKEKANILVTALGLVEQQSLTYPTAIPTGPMVFWGWRTLRYQPPRPQQPTCPTQVLSCSNRYGRSISTSTELTEAEETPANEEAVIPQLHEDITPMPFDLDKELSHIKAHRQKRQGTDRKDKYVLYILDSSGSIGETNFKKMRNVTAQFSLFYCQGTKIAAISYNNQVYKNYCFNCDQRKTVIRYNAIKSIPYRAGLTASGDAIQCACDYMLNSPCGFPRTSGQNAPEVDVVFITDGYSNHGKDVCTAANCWSSFYNINVFPIGIGNGVNYRELGCIKGNIGNGVSQFNLKDFSELFTLLADVKEESKGGKCI